MEIMQFFPPALGKYKIKAEDKEVIINHKDLFKEYQFEVEYKELSSKVRPGKQGDSDWTGVSLFFFIMAIPVNFLWQYITHTTNSIVFVTPYILAACAFALRFIKREYVAFYTLDDEFSFAVWKSGKKPVMSEDIVKYIIEKIEQSKTE